MTPAVLHILLSLAAEDRHGLGIAADVKEFTNGRLEFGPGTLYGTIKRLLDAGMVEDLGQPSTGEREERSGVTRPRERRAWRGAGGPALKNDDPRRRYYRITPKGRKALALETEGMASVLTVAKRRRVLKTP
jgi:DNA-binding PadR family transcriptional regulator